LGIGGPARWFVEAVSEDEIVEATGWTRERGAALLVLGDGSNLLIADRGWDGLVLRVGLKGIAVEDAAEADERIYGAAAGEDWDALVQRTVDDGFAGLECLAGIPGTVGGTPLQNVGAYGQEVASTIHRVRVFDLKERAFCELAPEECGFEYRRSRFNSTDRGRFVVTRVDYRLRARGAPTLRYAELQWELEQSTQPGTVPGKPPSLAEVAAAVRRIRRAKGMLLVEGEADCRSAGSFFKNPVVSLEQVKHVAAAGGKEPPQFAAGLDRVKLPAAWLIEQAGFTKGYAKGSAGISTRHTLALVNRGGATAADLLALAEEIKEAVKARFGIELEMEPVMAGF
jgi:UDP-N-acetylmuramate dehydrogenase